MPGSIQLLRVFLGLMGVGCAYMTGRSAAAVRKGWQKKSGLYRWMVRAAACLLVMAIRYPVDALDIAAWLLSAAAMAGGWWVTTRERKDDDLTGAMFPEGKD